MKNLSIKLLISLTIFAIILISVMSITTRTMLINDITAQQQATRADIENNILLDLNTMDKAHMIFQKNESIEMEQGLYELRDYYEENPNLSTWDLDEIKKSIGDMEFYIIDENNRIIITTHKPSENMDFTECCTKFVDLIQERLKTDQFYFDGLEISVATRDQFMYSYLPTPDHKYLLEFGILFGDTNVAKEFNYEETVSTLVDNHEDLTDLRIMTHEGFVLNLDDELLSYKDMSADIQEAFWQATQTLTTSEVVETFSNGSTETHRFIPYEADEVRGYATQRIIYAKYSNASEQALLKKSSAQFFGMLAVGILTSLILLFIILKILNNTIRLATYDTLTGAYNRASYLQHMDHLISNRGHFPVGLMLIDLDNFKQVNDLYGHTEGDNVLCAITDILKQVAGKEGYVVRFGGDEFAIIFERTSSRQLEKIASNLLMTMRERQYLDDTPSWKILSFSIGATIQQEPTEEEANLFERADRALYISKDNGKDGYTYIPPNPQNDTATYTFQKLDSSLQ